MGRYCFKCHEVIDANKPCIGEFHVFTYMKRPSMCNQVNILNHIVHETIHSE
jgi:hypothetical protein